MNTTNESFEQQILNFLHSADEPVKINQVSTALSILPDSQEYELLISSIQLLLEQGVIERTTRRRYIISQSQTDSNKRTVGILRFDSSGRYFVESTDKTPLKSSIEIKPQHISTALPGDTVEIGTTAHGKKKKKLPAISKIIIRAQHSFIGTIDDDGENIYVVAENNMYAYDFYVPLANLNTAKHGDTVRAEFVEWVSEDVSPRATIVEVLRRYGSAETEFDKIVKLYNLDVPFSNEVDITANASAVRERSLTDRVDIRDRIVVTIDPDDAKDFDDALSLEILPDGTQRLGVHIADVSTYVEEGSALDKEAYRRATSVYLADRVIPMLPEVLSNNVCSLVPHQDRLAFSVFITLDKNGNTLDWHIAETVINSKRRFTYNQAQEIIDGNDGEFSLLVRQLFTLSQVLRTRRFEEGGIDFVTSEVRYQLDQEKNPVSATRKGRTDATGMVEECMLLANRVVTEHVDAISKEWNLKHTLPFIYRIHDEPDTEKLHAALTFIRSLGVKTPNTIKSSKNINDLLEQLERTANTQAIHSILLRAQAKAVYSNTNIGHYGLGFKNYTHFTSPIRRYPDVIVHRLLKEYSIGKPTPQRIRQILSQLESIADHSSNNERSAVEAERASNKVAQVLIAKQHLGKQFKGTVTGVTNFGIFVLLDDIFAEGLVYLREIKDDYYYFEEKNFRVVGKRKKTIIGFGSRIEVQIMAVKIEKREIDLRFVEHCI